MESIQKETEEDLKQVRTDFGKRCRDIDTAVNEVRGQGQHNHETVSYTHLDVYKRQTLNKFENSHGGPHTR